MENIYEGCTQSEKEEIINGLQTNFSGIFEKLVEKSEVCKSEDGENVVKTYENVEMGDNGARMPNEQMEDLKKNQTNPKIVQRNLELHLSFEAQQKIQDILDEVRQLSEKEKLLLYLKLPTKTGLTDESQPIPLSNTRQEQTQAFQWIRSNLEECESTYTLPKHEVYEDYKSNCENLGANRTLSAPDFGKIIKCVFPKVKARRLGTRGNSKYCYSGLRKRVGNNSSGNANGNGENEVNNNNSNNNNSMNDCNDLTEDQTLSAACNLVCEWANKLLGRVFTTLLDLARFLVGGSYVSTKSMAAFVVMSATESKVRKMSEKLQFRSSSNSSISPDSKSNSSTRSQSPFDVPASVPSDTSSAKMQVMQQSPSNKSLAKNIFVTNDYQIVPNGAHERPQSLPGLQVTTGSQEQSKLANLMSPPHCLPPKSTNHQMIRGITASGNPPVFTGPVNQTRGIPSPAHNFLQSPDAASFPALVQQSPHQPIILPIQPHVANQSPEPHTKRQSHSQRTSLKRSDSCPYPSQSPRARQMAATQTMSPLSPRRPSDVIRTQNWQGTMGNQQAILLASPDNSIQSVNKLMQGQQQQQMLSPVRGTAIQETMATPISRQVTMQRPHSVPAPFNSPQGELYQPLTPQLRAGMSPVLSNNGPAFNQLKETRAKFLNNEINGSARRNLTPSFLIENDVMSTNKTKALKMRNLERKKERETSANNDIKIQERKSILNNETAAGNHNNTKCYGNGLIIRAGNLLAHQTAGNGSSNNRKQNIGVIDESSLNSVDSLMDSPFSLAGVDVSTGCDSITSGGSGLNELDGLDDAETIDLLRSLNSGNNIWVNEWNNGGMQLMEST